MKKSLCIGLISIMIGIGVLSGCTSLSESENTSPLLILESFTTKNRITKKGFANRVSTEGHVFFVTAYHLKGDEMWVWEDQQKNYLSALWESPERDILILGNKEKKLSKKEVCTFFVSLCTPTSDIPTTLYDENNSPYLISSQSIINDIEIEQKKLHGIFIILPKKSTQGESGKGIYDKKYILRGVLISVHQGGTLYSLW